MHVCVAEDSPEAGYLMVGAWSGLGVGPNILIVSKEKENFFNSRSSICASFGCMVRYRIPDHGVGS